MTAAAAAVGPSLSSHLCFLSAPSRGLSVFAPNKMGSSHRKGEVPLERVSRVPWGGGGAAPKPSSQSLERQKKLHGHFAEAMSFLFLSLFLFHLLI